MLVLGYPEERWRAEAARRGLSEHMLFPGRFAYADFASLLALGTVALSPKVSATEGNQKLYAYLEAGLPVVAFDTPVTREILGEAGVLVPSGDAAAFAREAIALAADPARREHALRGEPRTSARRSAPGTTWPPGSSTPTAPPARRGRASPSKPPPPPATLVRSFPPAVGGHRASSPAAPRP